MMIEDRPTPRLEAESYSSVLDTRPVPGLLLAHGPAGGYGVNRFEVTTEGVTVGRDSDADWPLNDPNLSKKHFRCWREKDRIFVADLGSTNGTFVRGERLQHTTEIHAHDVVRCGHCVMVLDPDLRRLADVQPAAWCSGLVGPFHAGRQIMRLREAATIGRPVLLYGESGVGKEIAAQILARLAGDENAGPPPVAHNCARMTSPEEATATLFGVGPRVFSEVGARPGLLEQADGGVLYLDEIHELPIRVQRSLLRFVEDGVSHRIGEDRGRKLNVRLVCSTNLSRAEVEQTNRVAHDLRSRLHAITVPALNERRADIPALFLHYARQYAHRCELDPDPVLRGIRTGHLEALCMVDYQHRNVRLLIQLAERLTARLMVERMEPRRALSVLLAERFPDNPVLHRVREQHKEPAAPQRSGSRSHYEDHRGRILAAFEASGRNLSATERNLKAEGLRISRRWLGEYLKRWGVR